MAKLSQVSIFLKKVGSFQKTADNFSNKFNDIVIESIKLLWEHGNINVINKVLEVSHHIKGIDRRALASYYKEVIPFKRDRSGMYTEKDKDLAKKLEKTWEAYIATTNWFDLSQTKEAKPYVFDVKSLVNLVHLRLQKAHDAGQLSEGKLVEAKAKLDQELNTFIKVSTARHVTEGEKAAPVLVPQKRKASKKAA